MKYAFISDIHGNAVALEAVIQSIKEQNVDKVFVLGDICFRGPEPKRSLELVHSIASGIIKGNADEWIVRGVAEGEVPSHVVDIMNKERDWTVSQLQNSDIKQLAALPLDVTISLLNHTQIHAFHATPSSLFDVVLPDTQQSVLKEKMMGHNEASIYLYGHIHLPYIRYFEGKSIANLGSVGLPFDGLTKASYLLLEENKQDYRMSIERVSYDVDKVIEQFSKSDYPNKEVLFSVIKKGTSPFS
ncbi:metallophosphoesterase family protein [Alkalihalobacillus sp. LMS39]|uniref:metallophosphoesterase family protein n=1 Tax=Alkalihalobacillus sp. LMS39 TaxID=2924032 RepID=UPI001FB38C0E|nr:metallophosphoesterase family protein [Alkalihalobacillus sp. LMS39]UOE92279.1 metallophosphoesterase family protein [Alkalihalobacillus sp. LMS39]